jgi:two-component system cell cycle response regulator
MMLANPLDRLLDRLGRLDRLPTPGPVALKLAELAGRDDTSVAEFVRTLKSDAALTARVLKFANSAAMSRRRVASVEDAVVWIGLGGVRRLALAFSIVECNRVGPCEAFDYALHWSRSLARAVAAEQFARRAGTIAPEDCFTVGLLSDVGSLALATVQPREYAALLREHPWSDESLAAAEAERFGATHRELARGMLRDWQLPPSLVDAATSEAATSPEPLDVSSTAPAWDPGRLAGLFTAAGCVADWCTGLGLTPLDPRLGALTGLDEESIDGAVDVAGVQWAVWKADFRITGSARSP